MRTARGRERIRTLIARHRESPWGRMLDASLVFLLCAGLFAASLPALTDLVSQLRSQQVISSMSSTTDLTYDATRLEQLRQAQAYNRCLGGPEAGVSNPGMGGSNGGETDILDMTEELTEDQIWDYELQLGQTGGPAMCWIEIPAIQVCEPVYHGTSDESLASGVGHLESSSLPVGGRSSRCVLAGHSGMRNCRMFDELDKLASGDHLVIKTLGDAYCYEVFDTEVLLPEEVEQHCRIMAGEDLCTLMTCTPYGINTHRLLVHARRVPFNAQDGQAGNTYRTVLLNNRTKPLLVLAGLLSGLTLAAIVVSKSGKTHLRVRTYKRRVVAW